MNPKKLRLLVYTIFFGSSSCMAEPIRNQDKQTIALVEVGDEKQLCSDCPIFVRVPDSPQNLRPIKYVSKFELTWNNYLAAYDDGTCPLPNPFAGYEPPKENNIPPHLDKYRVDWPIVLLSPEEIKCYMNWLQEKTDLVIALPTEAEWEWFARAGRDNVKFPWGDEFDLSREAVKGNNNPSESDLPLTYADGGKYIVHNVPGVKVGQFPPNDWGLYDIMGNSKELTADVVSGEEWLQRHPDSELALRARDYDVVTIKGSSRYNSNWREHGISDARYLRIFDHGYSSRAALRLIMINQNE